MKKRNWYRDIVFLLALCALAWATTGQIKAYCREQASYSCSIQSDGDLTEAIVGQMRGLRGILRFEPADTVFVTIRLETYVLETELAGVDLDSYPLRFRNAPDSIVICNAPQLFLGKEMFSMFADKNGHSPENSQIEKWIREYPSLELFVTDENGRERKARICGILESPEDMICMEKGQMEEVFGKCAHVSGGFLEIRGNKNMEKARKLLEDAGFAVRE